MKTLWSELAGKQNQIEDTIIESKWERYLDNWTQPLLWSSEMPVECSISLNNHTLPWIKTQLPSDRSPVSPFCWKQDLPEVLNWMSSHKTSGQNHSLSHSWIKRLLNLYRHTQGSTFSCSTKTSKEFRPSAPPEESIHFSSAEIIMREIKFLISWCISSGLMPAAL